jgi:hypothetical protein
MLSEIATTGHLTVVGTVRTRFISVPGSSCVHRSDGPGARSSNVRSHCCEPYLGFQSDRTTAGDALQKIPIGADNHEALRSP